MTGFVGVCGGFYFMFVSHKSVYNKPQQYQPVIRTFLASLHFPSLLPMIIIKIYIFHLFLVPDNVVKLYLQYIYILFPLCFE